ncbi:EAL domain-containing protein [Agarivorans sp. MS3-6]|uniref:EAL domain-containing protein n=1 Tax=Agarivorans sp. TSD2052 TaxID=2937286 RepID=UPI00200D28B4|nr:GGDEF and EAL domain-containing protein [Agarivorans sp. TSD2052]UPW20448.1 EAL domain-containing protein [Agarivorans sp. TSD2052]
MFKIKRISLSIVIPVLALVLLLVTQGLLLLGTLNEQQDKIAEDAAINLLNTGYQLQQSLSDSLSRHQWDIAERQITLVALNQGLDSLQVIDPQGLVQLSNHRAEKSLFAADSSNYFNGDLFTKVKNQRAPLTQILPQKWQVNLYLPLDMGPREDSLRRAEHGAIFVSYNLENAWLVKRQEIFSEAIKSFIYMSIAMLILVWMLNRILVKPVNKLVSRTKQIQTHNHLQIQAKSQGEIGALEHAISKMASGIHSSFAQLQRSEQRWQFALSGSGDGIWDWNLLTNTVYYSPQWKSMLGFQDSEVGEKIEEWESRIHPDDLDKTLNELRKHLKKKNKVYESMHRVRHKDGHYLWVLSRGMVVERSERGLPSRVISTQTNISEVRSAQELVRFQSSHDDITRLSNRRKLLENLDLEIDRSKRSKKVGALIYLDIDHFKNVNDMLGHAAGDLLLRLIAHRLREGRSSAETVARLGGDEFALLVPNLSNDREEAKNLATEMAVELSRIIHKEFIIKGNQITLNLTTGVALFPNLESNATEILRQADIALYHGKDLARSSVHVFSDKMADEIQERHLLTKMMREALENEDMVAYFQPRYNANFEMVGAETLLRWFDSKMGWISPGRFIPLAEENGLILLLGQWVMRSACETLKVWQDRGLPDNFKTLSINVSPNQFHRDTFVQETINIIQATGCDPKLIELEITEGVLVDNVQDTVEKIQALRDIGVRFSVDDFGTGYSSLAYLNKLPINCLKIDKSFVSELQSGGSECAIITTIISMAENLDLEVIAEGVETEYQLEFLKYRRCTVYQGFYFSEALEPEIFEDRLFIGQAEIA